MDRAIAARIQEWDTSPVPGGYRGLRELADASFSGAVTTGPAWLFMLNGRVVGVADGSLSDFESTEATAHEAPDPTLPLLFAMQEYGGETRAKYYTDDNPLREVHETLTEASFTGYLELSDNVLSGDYYVVYYGGRSMSAAFVGNAEQLVTGDEAFRQAAEEVGIYEVIDVELDVRDVPEPVEDDENAAATGGAAAAATEDAVEEDQADATTPDDADDAAEAPAPGDDEPPEVEPDQTADEPAAAEPSPVAEDAEAERAADAAEEADSAHEPADTAAADAGATDAADQAEATGSGPAEAPATASGQPDERAGAPPADEAAGEEDEDPFSEEAAWREARTIPALDPDETDPPTAAEDGGQQPAKAAQPAEPAPEPSAPSQPQESPPAREPAVDDDRLAELEAAIEAQSETIEELESRLESSSAEAEQLREEREALEDQLEAARAEAGSAGTGSAPTQSLDPEDALDQTDLFVRYGTKAGGTLEKAHDGKIDREEVVNNLRIDHHTRFEESEVTIAGQGFTSFLEETLEYRFVDWLVTHLLFEIQDTGGQRGLRELFDAIPLVDRVEFQGAVTWRDPEAGETHEEGFDVVCRDRMGRALIVANLNDVRDPATAEMMTSLIEGASTIAEGVETIGGAFMVTSSFFQPDALETASEATGGGLLSRDKRWSYVKLSRREGYHLCLVEARDDNFHVAVPEL